MTGVVFPNATEEQINEGRKLAWLSYAGVAAMFIPLAGLLFLVPMLAHKNNPFSHYHARQGMALFVFEIILALALGALWFIMGLMTYNLVSADQPAMFWIVLVGTGGTIILWNLVVAAVIFLEVLAIIGIVLSTQGRFVKLPIVGRIAESWFKKMIPTT